HTARTASQSGPTGRVGFEEDDSKALNAVINARVATDHGEDVGRRVEQRELVLTNLSEESDAFPKIQGSREVFQISPQRPVPSDEIDDVGYPGGDDRESPEHGIMAFVALSQTRHG